MSADLSLLDAVLRQAPDVAQVELDGETVVFEPGQESLTVLDQLGTVVWTLLDGTVAVRDLCEELAVAYQAPVERVQQDVLALVERLSAAHLAVADPAAR